ncbi:hypothetical protein [Xenorhabdus sp. BG5]|uniref:hypothetical protein n=1 Tax=Xenorhabdus sp. BG5 TaxID=2782014 RepID=UPI00187F0CDC|nr:hypothetical protein [Xenorhabdus sp. BG5]MBE8595281.1 hypothetical protein [Xenorhabdus sp. BG5]
MSMNLEESVLSALDEHYPELRHKLDHYDIEVTQANCSIRMWIKGEVLPRYVIFDRDIDTDNLYLTHGISNEI